jgi:hypothetical protein
MSVAKVIELRLPMVASHAFGVPADRPVTAHYRRRQPIPNQRC